jgi:release factor glutamine methyltransferase
LPGPVDLIIANLPYVREAELIDNVSLSYEPSLALNGGEDGLDRIRVLCRQAGNKLNDDGFILMEIGWGQAEAVTALLQEIYPSSRIEVDCDLAGIQRTVSLSLTLSHI